MRVAVDRGRCQGVGMCESLAPDLFEVNADAVSEVRREPTEADRAIVEEAVEACPMLALSLES